MLESLSINNLAILDKAVIQFEKGFSVFSGETGAGKSVLLGALSLLAGNKTSKDIIKSGQDYCRVDASILFSNPQKLNNLLENLNISTCEDGILILSRTISKEKPAKATINGCPVTSLILSQIGDLWIDFHGPGEPQKLFSTKNQLEMLDSYSNTNSSEYINLFLQREKILKKIEELTNLKQMSSDEIEFFQKRIKDIEKLNPTEDSISKLETDFKLLDNFREVLQKSSAITNIITNDEGVSEKLSLVIRLSSELENSSEVAKNLSHRLNALSIELDDISSEFESLSESCSFSDQEAEKIKIKMDIWLSLCRKYGHSVDAVLNAKNDMLEKIDYQQNVKSIIQNLELQSNQILQKLNPLAEKIFESRKSSSKKLSQKVLSLLKNLGFKNPRFEIAISKDKNHSLSCGSSCEFIFSANPGQDLMPLAKIASSGELARVMLALKTTLAEADSTPLLVFDEVDANIGGEIGNSVGKELKNLSKKHQVFCITHLPQVACFGDSHFLVEKNQTDNNTSVKILKLENKNRISELARMLGDRNSKTALDHAKRMLENI